MVGDILARDGMKRRRSGEEHESADGSVEDARDVATTQVRLSWDEGDPARQSASNGVGIESRQSPTTESAREVPSLQSGEPSSNSKKRKSEEIAKDTGVIAARDHATDQALSIDTRVANQPSAGSDGPSTGQTTQVSPVRSIVAPPNSPTSPRSRNRGLSLRSALFARNIDRRSENDASNIELRRVPSGDDATARPRSARGKRHAVILETSPVEPESTSDVPVQRPAPIRLKSHDVIGVPFYKSTRGSTVVTKCQILCKDYAYRYLPAKRVRDGYRKAWKYFSRIQEIPPSKDGRHIPLDPFRKKALVDERTGHAFLSNFIKSSKYTPWNFLPRQLFAQFSKLANLYFLVVSILQMIPGLSTTGTYTTIIPLMFFISISMAKEGYEDLRRHRLDKAENNRTANVLHAYRPVRLSMENTVSDQPEVDQAGPKHWAPVKWQSLQVGDVVKLERNEAVPADILLLDSKGANNIAYIETMALDGETNLKTKQPSAALVGSCSTPESIADLQNVKIVTEDPNMDLYNFEGKVSVEGELAPLTTNEIIYRGSILRNTPEATGIVVYSGEECKIRMNANKNPRIKAPSLQASVNRIVMCMVVFVVCLALLCTILYQVWHAEFETKAWYLTNAKVSFGPIVVSFIIMFNTMIPLSLYVSMEIIKVVQIYLMNDVDMYEEVSNTPFEARTSTINEELGQVSYVFSDKTGTLTENVMNFRKLSVAGMAWLHDADLKDQPHEELLQHKKRKSKGKLPMPRSSHKSGPEHNLAQNRSNSLLDAPRKSTVTWGSGARGIAQPELTTTEMIQYIQRRPHTAFARKARMALLAMALCHTCLPEHGENEGDISYQASSPDELALVEAARELGYLVFDREVAVLTIKSYPKGADEEPVLDKYEVLDIIEFSSQRKRMSVVVRLPDDRICCICKGADSVITQRLRLASLANQKIAEIEKRVDERRSLEAQEALRRRRSTMERHSSIGTMPKLSMARRSTARQSVGGLGSIRDDVDGWLRDREQEIALPAERSHYTPRPSAQVPRVSAAPSERSLGSEFDDADLVEESLVLNDSAVIERCFQHVNDFATEGLRTLLYGHRFLNKEEYQSWKMIYQEASTSLIDRQKMIEAAGELIERDLELTSATAIEDKLQDGVPDTIDRLRRANIKLWMLTGDKRETAINIGHSCRLIKDYSSVTILDHEAGGVHESIAATVSDIGRGTVAHAVIVIDGHTLGMIQTDESLHTLFLDLAILADSVICCRASPSQKAHLVHAVRRRVNKSVTLAIGDGANDIAMIQEAHVGIGITGKEGLQAARTSDYSIAQFRFLNKLLLVHGRWNYIRTCKYILATFWKELLFYLTQALYQRWNGYTGTSLYEQWSLSQFNTLFTSLPVIFLGAFEKDLAPATLLAVPELYTKGQRFAGFNFRVYLSWMFMAASEAMIIFFTMKKLFGESLFTSGKDLFAMGDMTFTACIILINTKLQLLEQRNRTVIALICMVVEVGGWWLWNIAFSQVYEDNFVYNVRGGLSDRFGANPLWWLCLILIVAGCLLFESAVRAIKNALFPTDEEVFQQLERDLAVRRRFEEASAPLLQGGWNHGTKKSSLELQREAEEQAKREGEVEDLLNRPRIMEEGRSDTKKHSRVETEEVLESGPAPVRRSTEMQEMLARHFGTIRRGELRSNSAVA